MAGKKLIELRHVSKLFKVGGGLGLSSRGFIKAVDDVSFDLPAEEPNMTALVGESGSGKSTIARMILGLIDSTSGEIFYKDKNIKTILEKDPKTYRREVQGIFQDPYSVYNPFYRVERILQLAVRKFNLASKRDDETKLINETLKAIGLRPEDIIGRYPHQLSGGERQRLMLARILILKPNLIVADEPVSMLDASLRAVFLDILKTFKNKLGISCIYITHDLNIANYASDRIMVLCRGNIIEKGDSKALVKEPLHPYAKLLVQSIPIPDPNKRWSDKLEFKVANLAETQSTADACVFCPRCPYAMDICAKEKPSMKDHGTNHDVACFLYK